MTFHPRYFVFVWPNTIQIGAVRAREQVPRLKEVNMCIDVTGQNEFAFAINLFPERRRALLPHGDVFDLLAVDHHGRIRHHLAAGRIDHGRPDKCDLFGPHCYCEDRKSKDERDSEFHTARDSSTSLGMTK